MERLTGKHVPQASPGSPSSSVASLSTNRSIALSSARSRGSFGGKETIGGWGRLRSAMLRERERERDRKKEKERHTLTHWIYIYIYIYIEIEIHIIHSSQAKNLNANFIFTLHIHPDFWRIIDAGLGLGSLAAAAGGVRSWRGTPSFVLG